MAELYTALWTEPLTACHPSSPTSTQYAAEKSLPRKNPTILPERSADSFSACRNIKRTKRCDRFAKAAARPPCTLSRQDFRFAKMLWRFLVDDMLALTETNKNLQAGPSMCTAVISQPSQIVKNSALFLQSAWIALRMRVSHHPAELFQAQTL
jgi:hypothetical protein